MWNLFLGKQHAKGIKKLNRDQLDRERIRLEGAERRITRDIELLELKKEELFREGSSAISDRQRLQLARRIKDMEVQIQAKDRQLGMIAQKLRAVQSLNQLEEGQQTLTSLTADSVLKDLNWGDIKDVVDQLNAEQELAASRYGDLQQSMSQTGLDQSSAGDDKDTLAILEAMQKAAFDGDEMAVGRELDQVTHQLRMRTMDHPGSTA